MKMSPFEKITYEDISNSNLLKMIEIKFKSEENIIKIQ